MDAMTYYNGQPELVQAALEAGTFGVGQLHVGYREIMYEGTWATWTIRWRGFE